MSTYQDKVFEKYWRGYINDHRDLIRAKGWSEVSRAKAYREWCDTLPKNETDRGKVLKELERTFDK